MPYIGEIRMFGGNFAPAGWMFCEGQLLPISENDALFTLIGTTYGGDGQDNFRLPDLQGRHPVHQGQGPGLQNYQIGARAGVESVTLTTQQTPVHTHAFVASTDPGNDPNPNNNVIGTPPAISPFLRDSPSLNMAPTMVAPAGGSQPHENRQPYLCISFIISLFGVFPTQT